MSTSQRRKSEHDEELGPMDIESPKDPGGLRRPLPQDRPVSSMLETEMQGARPVSGSSVTFANERQGEKEGYGDGRPF